MGFHRLPPIAIRLRLNRGFDSAWYADSQGYAKLLQKDWLLTRAAWSLVQRSSRRVPADASCVTSMHPCIALGDWA